MKPTGKKTERTTTDPLQAGDHGALVEIWVVVFY